MARKPAGTAVDNGLKPQPAESISWYFVSEGGLERRILPSHPVPPSPCLCRSVAVFGRTVSQRVTSRTGPYNPVSRTFADKVMTSPGPCRAQDRA